jgi:hypothetical protein
MFSTVMYSCISLSVPVVIPFLRTMVKNKFSRLYISENPFFKCVNETVAICVCEHLNDLHISLTENLALLFAMYRTKTVWSALGYNVFRLFEKMCPDLVIEALLKKLSSYMRKFRLDRLQSHI